MPFPMWMAMMETWTHFLGGGIGALNAGTGALFSGLGDFIAAFN
ncbi:hypothetical protein SMNI109538_06700 [Smaragdicoccus niigatensis]